MAKARPRGSGTGGFASTVDPRKVLLQQKLKRQEKREAAKARAKAKTKKLQEVEARGETHGSLVVRAQLSKPHVRRALLRDASEDQKAAGKKGTAAQVEKLGQTGGRKDISALRKATTAENAPSGLARFAKGELRRRRKQVARQAKTDVKLSSAKKAEESAKERLGRLAKEGQRAEDLATAGRDPIATLQKRQAEVREAGEKKAKEFREKRAPEIRKQVSGKAKEVAIAEEAGKAQKAAVEAAKVRVPKTEAEVERERETSQKREADIKTRFPHVPPAERREAVRKHGDDTDALDADLSKQDADFKRLGVPRTKGGIIQNVIKGIGTGSGQLLKQRREAREKLRKEKAKKKALETRKGK